MKSKPTAKWFTYRGLLTCGECGRAVTAGVHKGHTYYHCTKSGGPGSCSQQYVREGALADQVAQQIRPIELTGREYDLLREVLKESHSDEQRFRDEQLANLQRLKANIQGKLDALLDRLVDGTITKEAYNAKSEALEKERQSVEVAIYGHEQANRSYFEQMENFLEAAKSIHRVFLAGSPKRKRQVVQLVALNGVLTDQKVHLNLKRPCAILAARPSIPYGVTDGT
jgi:site-specific DNA recombinase